MKCLTCTAVLQREKSFVCLFPIYHLPKLYSQEILISSLFVFGSFILVLHSYSKQRPFKMLWEALFLFASLLEVFLSQFVPVWQTANRLNFSSCPFSLLTLVTTGIDSFVVCCGTAWNETWFQQRWTHFHLQGPNWKTYFMFSTSKSSIIKDI